MLQSLFVCRRLLTGGTVIPVSLIAVVPTFLEKSVFYGYLAVASVSLGLPTQFVHCCLAATRAFMPASLIVIPYTILEISKFLGQLPVDDDDDDDEKCQLNASIAWLRSELNVCHTLCVLRRTAMMTGEFKTTPARLQIERDSIRQVIVNNK